ncbi:cupin domain-containing protein [Fodinibius sp. Rm-B-1B1-1]|uniref:cupin domain-containing protein n=1 Tax=Fodinibius alkaliphilus TaxID=3140241 RepID=UPI00315AA52D
MESEEQNRILDFGGFPGRWEIIHSTAETDGEYLEMRFEINSTTGDSPPVHIHPKAEESYEVLSGTLEVKVKGEWKQVHTGEKHSVSPGTPHTFRNKEPVELINVHQPALEYERFFRRFQKLVTEQGVNLPPNNFKSFLLLGMLFSAHEQEVISVKPPQFVMRILSGLGKSLGYQLPK